MITHLQPLDYWLWAIEFILEAVLLTVAFRRGMLTLSAYAIARAVFDVISYGVLANFNAYELAFWLLKPLEYFFQIILALTCIGFMVRESKIYVRLFSLGVSMVATLCVIMAYVLGPMKYSRMLDIEVSVNMLLGIALVVGLLSGGAEKPWRMVAYGLVILGVSNALLGLLTPMYREQWWDVIARAYPLCEITALSVFLAGPLRGLGEFRASLGRKLELPKEEIMTRII